MPVFLTAPKDLQRTPAYEELLRLLLRREEHQGEEVVADRDLFEDTRHWKKNWKKIYRRADKLYVLARADGTVGLGIYKQWRFLSERGVPSAVFFEGAKETEGHEDFVLERIEAPEGGEEDQARFALVRLGSSAKLDSTE